MPVVVGGPGSLGAQAPDCLPEALFVDASQYLCICALGNINQASRYPWVAIGSHPYSRYGGWLTPGDLELPLRCIYACARTLPPTVSIRFIAPSPSRPRPNTKAGGGDSAADQASAQTTARHGNYPFPGGPATTCSLARFHGPWLARVLGNLQAWRCWMRDGARSVREQTPVPASEASRLPPTTPGARFAPLAHRMRLNEASVAAQLARLLALLLVGCKGGWMASCRACLLNIPLLGVLSPKTYH